MSAENLSQRELLERWRHAKESQPAVRQAVEERLEALRTERKRREENLGRVVG